MNNIELLAPVGDFECLKAAIQNGADAVYLGASDFSARASAKNFSLDELETAINYAALRNVKVHLALNTLIKNDEFDFVLNIAKKAYEFGIDAIIVQDYGLACTLLKFLPDLPIHASTQMTIHNLEGAKTVEKLGFSRAVLSRELSISEIEYIRNNCNIELEVFIHGALCISYSGQCLMSSMIGARSGNRGKCAQACRLPYELVCMDSKIHTLDKGFLLSPKDLCGLDFIPKLFNIGINSLKIEGRMKTPQYVATVTRIYRKYLDLAKSGLDYCVCEQDKKDLLQVFNRGGFSYGHLDNDPNKSLIFKDKPNNMGIYVGNVSNYNSTKGHITLKLNDDLSIGDTITFENENSKYKISELLINNSNCDMACIGSIVKIGRMKGNIKAGDKIFKIESKILSNFASSTYSAKENIKTNLNCNVTIKKDSPIFAEVFGPNNLYNHVILEDYPTYAINNPISSERIIAQFSKTGNSPFNFKDITVNLDENLYVNISTINELRRRCLFASEQSILNSIKKTTNTKFNDLPTLKEHTSCISNKKISLLLNILDVNTNYSNLNNVDRVYIPLKYFTISEYSNIIKNICLKFETYIYMPYIIKPNYRNLFSSNIDIALQTYNIKGFVVSNIGTFKLLEKYSGKYEFIGNYTLNVLNNATLSEFYKFGLQTITLSPELNKSDVDDICNTSKFNTEFIVYGNLPIMTCNYCFLGKSNKCYPNCKALCTSSCSYYLKDRIGLYFKLLPDNTQTISTIYNSKTTFISSSNLNVHSLRIDILDENILEINNIIETVKSGNRLEGKNYTNGNFNREI